jgi:murein DD-endopeptidase MepM/ murein hydrolase activator NlpD
VQSTGAEIEFAPAELIPGGSAIVYFDQPATAATLSFGGKQYPMLSDGQRWWAIVGIGAFSEVGTAPVTITYDPAGSTKQAQASGSIEIVSRDYPVENIDLDDETSALLDPAIVNNEEAFRSALFAGYTMQRLWSGPFQAPSTAPIGDGYGIARSYNGGPVSSYHRGTDFTAGTGDPAYAAAGGRVVFAGELQVRGNAIIIDHGVGVFTTYNHLSEIDVSEGDLVTAGQTIGLTGSTGLVTGPHLHWEVVVRGIEVDGALWLANSGSLP